MKEWIKKVCSKDMVIVLVFGITSGLPLALVFGTLSLWLKDYDIAYRTIGAFSLVRLPYSFKWLWAPVVESVKIPLLYKLGKRKSWALVMQFCLLLSIVGISCFNPKECIYEVAVMALLISFFSATQDIVLDAFRVEMFSGKQKDEVNGATVYVLGYRVGSVISSAGAIGLASCLSWNMVYFIIGLLIVVGMWAVLMAKEPKFKDERKKEKVVWKYVLLRPIVLFMQKQYWVSALCLVLLYRLSDAYFGPMAYPFYDDLGFSKIEIAYISKIYGMIATIVGGILGGYVINKIGILRGLLIFAFLQGATNLLYIPLYYVGHSVWGLMVTIAVENLCSGMATTAIIAFMSLLCNKGYSATQYALLSSMPGFMRDVFSSTSGKVLELTSWPVFFGISALLALPAVGISWYLLKKRPSYLIKT